MKEKNSSKSDHQWSFEYLLKEFNKESDRASVILVASILDESLYSLLRSYFVPIASSNDELFEGANAPLGTFSSKIDIAYRIGLISSKFCRDLHLIRKIRNSFAHDIFDCTFENGSVKSRIDELIKSAIGKITADDGDESIPKGHKGEFLMIASNMLFELNDLRKEKDNLPECAVEFFYKKK